MKRSLVAALLSLLAIAKGADSQSPNAPAPQRPKPEKLIRVSLRIDTIDVEISQPSTLLWKGMVRVNRMNRAIYSLEGEEAAGSGCRPMGSHSNSYRITLNVMKWGGNATDPDEYRIDSTLNRKDLAANCLDVIPSGSRIYREVVKIRRGQTVELSGDQGFHITLSRVFR